jgi:DNA-binding response OmpR family regulator
MTKRVLVVEDDAGIRQGIVDALEFEGYQVYEAGTGDEGLDKALKVEIDLLLLDLVLPGCDGLEILRQVRKVYATLPVIILTAKGDENDRVEGLRLGADDYVVKPFSVRELLARVAAVLRRSPERPVAVKEFRLASGLVDLERCEVRFDDGESCQLSEREIDVLSYLVSNPGRAISREELLRRVWRIEAKGVETRTIDMHVARLREKLRDDSGDPRVLVTVRGKGYMFSGSDVPL